MYKTSCQVKHHHEDFCYKPLHGLAHGAEVGTLRSPMASHAVGMFSGISSVSLSFASFHPYAPYRYVLVLCKGLL
jgi:hypothetical protein